jgi:hypothetical protein
LLPTFICAINDTAFDAVLQPRSFPSIRTPQIHHFSDISALLRLFPFIIV